MLEGIENLRKTQQEEQEQMKKQFDQMLEI